MARNGLHGKVPRPGTASAPRTEAPTTPAQDTRCPGPDPGPRRPARTAWHGKAPRPGTASAPRPEAPTTPAQDTRCPGPDPGPRRPARNGLAWQSPTAWRWLAPRGPKRPRHPPKTTAAPDLIRGLDDMARNARRERPRPTRSQKRPPSSPAPQSRPRVKPGAGHLPQGLHPRPGMLSPAPDFPRGGRWTTSGRNISKRIGGGRRGRAGRGAPCRAGQEGRGRPEDAQPGQDEPGGAQGRRPEAQRPARRDRRALQAKKAALADAALDARLATNGWT